MEKRLFGNTGEKLSFIGFGGIIVSDTEQTDANNYVAEAIHNGVNYFDVAPSYGNAQERLGPALVGKRQNIFLACKTNKRTKAESEEELNASLRTLKTDYFDLYQFHGVTTLKDVETILKPGGAMETFVKAQKAGKIKYLGFSAHTEEAALALMDNFNFTSVLFPINWASYFNAGFSHNILEKASEKGMAKLALKALAKTDWPEGLEHNLRKYPKCWYEPIDDEKLATLALRFTLSKPITAAIPPGDIRLFRMALRIAQNYQPLSEVELDELKTYAAEIKSIFPRNY
jgi:predicted aldo/keto reductase-like oxidoreductase